jgi:hypothetical protein
MCHSWIVLQNFSSWGEEKTYKHLEAWKFKHPLVDHAFNNVNHGDEVLHRLWYLGIYGIHLLFGIMQCNNFLLNFY